jgi:hypothetical protein
VGWAGYVECMEACLRSLVAKPEKRDHKEDLDMAGRMILSRVSELSVGSGSLQNLLPLNQVEVKVRVMLRPTVSRPVSLGVKPHPGLLLSVVGLLMCGARPDERTSLSFTIAAGPLQRSHSRVRVPRDPYFTVSDSRLLQPGGPGSRIYIP